MPSEKRRVSALFDAGGEGIGQLSDDPVRSSYENGVGAGRIGALTQPARHCQRLKLPIYRQFHLLKTLIHGYIFSTPLYVT